MIEVPFLHHFIIVFTIQPCTRKRMSRLNCVHASLLSRAFIGASRYVARFIVNANHGIVRTAENRGNHGGKRANFWLDRLNGIFVETLSLRSESGGRARRLSLGISSPLSDLQSLGQLPREGEK